MMSSSDYEKIATILNKSFKDVRKWVSPDVAIQAIIRVEVEIIELFKADNSDFDVVNWITMVHGEQ